MWVSPNHPDRERLTRGSTVGQVQRPEPPQDHGRRLASFARGKQGGPRSELRVSLDRFNGHEFISARVWTANREGEMWPTRSGVTIRLREVEAFIDALREGAELAERGEGRSGADPRPEQAKNRQSGQGDFVDDRAGRS
jgi:hypothetical protein